MKNLSVQTRSHSEDRSQWCVDFLRAEGEVRGVLQLAGTLRRAQLAACGTEPRWRGTDLKSVRRGGTPIPPVLRGSAAPRTTQRNRSSAGRTDFKSVLRRASASFRQPDCENRIRGRLKSRVTEDSRPRLSGQTGLRPVPTAGTAVFRLTTAPGLPRRWISKTTKKAPAPQ